MKFVKRISLFFIYPMTMFGLGFASNMAISEFFYPGNLSDKGLIQKEPVIQKSDIIETGFKAPPVITANTGYVILSYDIVNGEVQESKEMPPDKYIGLDREGLEEELKLYEESPSLMDMEKGFSGIELVSFSPERVIVRKNYDSEEDQQGYFLVNENNNVVVYDKSLMHIYMDTGIEIEELPWNLQNEIIRMKYIESESELYNFLESYSS